MAALLQGVDNIYEIDTTLGILNRATELTGAKYGANERDDVALRIVADHARTCVFLIGDGVLPGNEGRGYVLRRLMRRTIRMMRLLGAHEPVMSELVDATVRTMAPQYPELNDEVSRVRQHAVAEELVFLQTLRTGTTIFDTAAEPRCARPAARWSRASRRSPCTTRTASRSTSRSRWLPSRGSRSTRTASAASCSSSGSARRPTRAPARAASSRRRPTATSSARAARRRSPATTSRSASPRSSASSRTARPCRPRSWASTSRSSWTARRSTPRPAGSSAITAAS